MSILSPVLTFLRIALLPLLIVFTASAPEAYSTLLNARFYPAIPWSVLIIGGYMFLWVKFYKGGILSRGAQYRRECFRSTVPGRDPFKWGMLTGGLFAISIFCILLLLFRTFRIPVTQLPLTGLPPYMVIPFLLKLSVVAGISEEVGFRGYMQFPLEKKFGKGAAILITTLFFIIAHLGHLEFLYLIPIYILYSFMLGVIAHYTKSLLPSILLHSVFDFTVFMCYYIFGGRGNIKTNQ
ncbi:MAG: type II CAAX endopeptidase family protein [Bacteroidota bacterium]